MRKKITGFAALLACMVAGGVFAQELTQVNEPGAVSLNADLPRTELKSYNSRDFALRRLDDSSSYIRSLAGTWKIKPFGNAADVDTMQAKPEYSASTWADVTVPETRTHNTSAATYRRDFTMPFAWIDREVFVHIGAVNRACYVYINGTLAGYHEDSKTGRDFNVTKLVKDGKNHIALIVYANPVSATLENQIPMQGTALGQDIYVFTQPRVRIRDYVVDTGFDPTGTDGIFSFGAIVKSYLLNTRNVTIYYELIDPAGEVVSSARRDARFDLRSEDTVRFAATVPNVKTWSHESPMLYTVAMRIQHEGRFTEYMAAKVGFRKVSYDNRGLLINGKHFDIYAINYNPPADTAELREQLAAMKRKGINMLRVNNGPQSELFYELCDNFGFYLCNQANIDSHLSGESLAVGGNPANDTVWAAAYLDRVANMYHTSKNHPSVVMFSLGREGGKGYNMYEAYLALKAEEKERPVIYEYAGAEWNTDFVAGSADRQAGATGVAEVMPRRNPSDARPAILFHDMSYTPDMVNPGGDMVILSESTAAGEIFIRNNHKIANVNNFLTTYKILSGRRVIREGAIAGNVPAGSTGNIIIPAEGVKPGKYTVQITVEHAYTPSPTNTREIITQKTFSLNIPKVK